MLTRAISIALVAALVGCADPTFHCSASADCLFDGAVGKCEPSGYCSFTDGACATGQRYGSLAPTALASQCVAPAPSLCATSGAALCDGFEAPAFDPEWTQFTRHGALALDSTHVYRGAQAVRLSLEANATEQVQAELVEQRTFPANDFFMREFVYLPSTTPAALMQLIIAYEIVQPLQGMVLTVVPRAGGFVPGLLNEITGMQEASTLEPLAADRWTCLEWEVQVGNPGSVRVWIDDVERTDLTVAQRTTPGTPIAQIAFGDTQDPGVPAHALWLDEVAVDSQRIGCTR